VTAPQRIQRKRTKTAVHIYREDGFLVRGTLDPMEALKLAIEEDEDCRIAGYYTTPDWDVIDPRDIDMLADILHGHLATARPGLYRVVPAPRDDDDYRWYVWPADARGPGVFEGVEFS